MCIQLVLGLKPPWSGWIFDVWEDSLVRRSFSSTLLTTGSSVINPSEVGWIGGVDIPSFGDGDY